MKFYNWIFILLAFVFFVGCTQPQTIVIDKENVKEINSLTVQGVAEFDTAPDEAVITFAVVTQDFNPKIAQEENRKKANKVMQALMFEGLTKKQIETTYYNLQKITEWDHELKKQVEKGYKVTNNLKVTLKDLNIVGYVLDAVVNAGVNKVNDVHFKLSNQKKAEVKAEALKLAAQNAKIKADSLAIGSDVTLGKVRTVQEEFFDSYPVRSYTEKYVTGSAMSTGMPSTPISPEQVHINVKVKIVYAI